MSAFAATGCVAVAGIPAEKTVTFWVPGGSSPTMSIPFTGRNSLICWKPISNSPLARTPPTGSASIFLLFPLIWSAIPNFGNNSVER